MMSNPNEPYNKDALTQSLAEADDENYPSTATASEFEPKDQAQEYLTSGLDRLDSTSGGSQFNDALADFAATMATSMYELRTAFLGLTQDERFQAALASFAQAAQVAETVPYPDDTDAVSTTERIATQNAAAHWIAGVIVGRVKTLLDEAQVDQFIVLDELGGYPVRTAKYSGRVYNTIAIDTLLALQNHIDLFKDNKIEASDLDEMIEIIAGREH